MSFERILDILNFTQDQDNISGEPGCFANEKHKFSSGNPTINYIVPTANFDDEDLQDFINLSSPNESTYPHNQSLDLDRSGLSFSRDILNSSWSDKHFAYNLKRRRMCKINSEKISKRKLLFTLKSFFMKFLETKKAKKMIHDYYIQRGTDAKDYKSFSNLIRLKTTRFFFSVLKKEDFSFHKGHEEQEIFKTINSLLFIFITEEAERIFQLKSRRSPKSKPVYIKTLNISKRFI